MRLLVRWFLSAGLLMLIAYLIPGIRVSSFYAALIAALVLGLINAVIRPLVSLLALPITLLTLGLFSFVINALMFYGASTIVKGFEVHGFLAALMGALAMSVGGWVINLIASKKSD